MKWFFQPRSVSNEPERDDDDSSPGLIGLPAPVLQRHGARVLDPGKAAVVAQPRNAPPRDEEREAPPPPRPTVYRARTLLIPDDLLQDAAFTEFINRILARVHMMVVPPTLMTDPDPDPGRRDQRILEILRELRELPRTAVLAPREDDPVPVVIDAWIALQTLRAAARPDRKQDLDEKLLETLIERIGEFSLEHVLIGSTIMGAPATDNAGGLTGGSNSGSDGSGPTISDSYQFSGGDTRTPVTVLLDPPARRPPGNASMTTAGARWSPSWTRASCRIRGWKGTRRRPGVVTARPLAALSRSMTRSRTPSARRGSRPGRAATNRAR